MPVVLGGGVVQQVLLLLDRRELGVPLIDDEGEQGVPDGLVRYLAHPLPFGLALVVAEFDVVGVNVAELGLELVVAQQVGVIADVPLPFLEAVDPVVESGYPGHLRDSLFLMGFQTIVR